MDNCFDDLELNVPVSFEDVIGYLERKLNEMTREWNRSETFGVTSRMTYDIVKPRENAQFEVDLKLVARKNGWGIRTDRVRAIYSEELELVSVEMYLGKIHSRVVPKNRVAMKEMINQEMTELVKYLGEQGKVFFQTKYRDIRLQPEQK